MEYIYGAMLLHKAGKEVNEQNVKKVLEAAGVKVEEARVKALVSALDGVNIDEANCPGIKERREERRRPREESRRSSSRIR